MVRRKQIRSWSINEGRPKDDVAFSPQGGTTMRLREGGREGGRKGRRMEGRQTGRAMDEDEWVDGDELLCMCMCMCIIVPDSSESGLGLV
jgi:hypothetical protein